MNATMTYDELVRSMRAQGIPLERAEAFARKEIGVAAPSADEMREELESTHEEEGDRLMRSLGFEVVKLSQRRRAKVTEGISDRRYYHRGRKLALWWEAKAERGRQRPDQRAFQEMVEAVGETYVLGGLEALKEWIVEARVATRDGEVFHPTQYRTPLRAT